MDYSPGPVSSAAAAALLFAAFTLAAHGQQGSTTIAAAERASRERMAREAAESEERDMMFALIERYHRSGQPLRDPRLAFAQIREDFIRIQVVNNDLAKAVAGGGQLDLKLVAKSASEIKRRAERLKDNLALPEEEGDDKSPAATLPADAEQLKTALSQLDGMILKFANELHAKGVRRFDAKSSGKMRRDLEEIIALSGRAKKSCEKLEKSAAQK